MLEPDVAVQVACPKCEKELRVPSTHLNKKVKCPGCQHRFTVRSNGLASSAADQKARWRMRGVGGQEYGPVSRADLESWVAEGRVDARCQLLEEGADQWQWADEVFPALADSAPHTGEIAQVTAADDFPQQTEHDASVQASADRPAPPLLPSQTSLRDVASSDGVTPGIRRAMSGTGPWVLFLAIVGFLIFALSAVAVVARAMFTITAAGSAGISAGAMSIVELVLLAFFYLLPSYLLLRYQHAIGTFLRNDTLQNLHRALDAQRRFWTTLGVLMMLAVAAGLVAIVVLFMWGLARA